MTGLMAMSCASATRTSQRSRGCLDYKRELKLRSEAHFVSRAGTTETRRRFNSSTTFKKSHTTQKSKSNRTKVQIKAPSCKLKAKLHATWQAPGVSCLLPRKANQDQHGGWCCDVCRGVCRQFSVSPPFQPRPLHRLLVLNGNAPSSQPTALDSDITSAATHNGVSSTSVGYAIDSRDGPKAAMNHRSLLD